MNVGSGHAEAVGKGLAEYFDSSGGEPWLRPLPIAHCEPSTLFFYLHWLFFM